MTVMDKIGYKILEIIGQMARDKKLSFPHGLIIRYKDRFLEITEK